MFEHNFENKYIIKNVRERVIIVGFRDMEDFRRFSFPQSLPNRNRKVLGDVIMEEENRNEKLFFSEKAVAGMKAVKEKMNKGRAMCIDEPCNTISAHLAKVSLNSTDPVFMVGDRYRRFSTREAARIQSFPDSFKLDSVSQIRQYKAIGNAVPPVMMWYIANAIHRTSEHESTQKKEINVEMPSLTPKQLSIWEEEYEHKDTDNQPKLTCFANR